MLVVERREDAEVFMSGKRPVLREELERGKNAGVLTEREGDHSQERCKTAGVLP